MTRFKHSQRVRLVSAGFPELRPLVGKVGTVVRLKMANRSAWVEMDEPLPTELRSFPDGDLRVKHIVLWPEDCEGVAR